MGHGVLSIRRRLPADAAFIRSLGHAAFHEYEGEAGRATLSMALRATTLVAVREGVKLGFVVVEPPVERAAYIGALAVIEEARGIGIGRRLIRAAEAISRARGATRLELTTADSNVAALQLFLRSGFRRSARTPHAYPRGQRALVLEKNLGARAGGEGR